MNLYCTHLYAKQRTLTWKTCNVVHTIGSVVHLLSKGGGGGGGGGLYFFSSQVQHPTITLSKMKPDCVVNVDSTMECRVNARGRLHD